MCFFFLFLAVSRNPFAIKKHATTPKGQHDAKEEDKGEKGEKGDRKRKEVVADKVSPAAKRSKQATSK